MNTQNKQLLEKLLSWILKKWDWVWGCMDWVDLAQDRDRWQARVNEVWTLWFHKMY